MSAERSLATATSRGALVNLGFAVVVQGLVAVQMVLVPRLIGPDNIGLFALAMGGVAIGSSLKELGIPKKLVQERDVDLHTSYSVAFTLELLLATVSLLVVLVMAPLLAILYDRPELWLLTSVLGLSIFTVAFLELPAALPYREMRYTRHNILKAIGPVVSFAVTIPAAFAGWGVWSLAAGALAGFLAAALVMAIQSSMRPRLRWHRSLVRRYLVFGWPLWAGQLLAVAAGWGSVFVVSTTIGVAGLGYFQFAQSLAQRAVKVDDLVVEAVFPALCSVQSSTARLWRAFVITTRVSMLWAAPVGFGMVVFAEPVVDLFLGPEWEPAILMVRAQGAGVVVTSIAYNWDLFYAARGETKPQFVVSLFGAVWLIAVVIPFLWLWEIEGAAAAIVVLAVGTYSVREYYLRRLFGPFRMFGVVWREIAAAALAALAIGGLRASGWKSDRVIDLLLQGGCFVLLCGVLSAVASRSVIAEVWWALRSGTRSGDAEDSSDEGGQTAATAEAATLTISTPRVQAFPLGVTSDPTTDALWVTTRDHPALGRIPLGGGEPAWVELPPFPHVPTPDGRGGCWTALTRHSAIAHVDRDLTVTLIDVPESDELLITTRHAGAIWVVDAGNRTLIAVDETDHRVTTMALPDDMVRPDFVASHGGKLFVADTHTETLAAVDPAAGTVTRLVGPHPARFVVDDPRRGGIWLGASDRHLLTLVDGEARPLIEVEIPDIPFGIALLDDDVIVALKARGEIVRITPEGPTGPTSVVVASQPGSAPMDIAVTAGGRVFATLSLASVVAEVGLATGAPPQDLSAPSA